MGDGDDGTHNGNLNTALPATVQKTRPQAVTPVGDGHQWTQGRNRDIQLRGSQQREVTAGEMDLL